MGKRSAIIVVSIFFATCVFLALNYTFVEPRMFTAIMAISMAFTFYFGIRNPELLICKSFNEMMDKYDGLRDLKFLTGTTPLYPATLLIAITYIAIVKYGWPF